MHFYKTKFDAATPTRVQLNVPTNTDFMVGTELYVKGQKKEVTAENVKLSPSPKQYVDEAITLKYGADTEWATWNGTTHQWTILKPFTIKPHYYVDSGTVVENTDHTAISYGTWYDTTGPAMITVNSIRSSTGSVVANIKRYRTADVATYGLKPEYYCIQTTAYVSEFAVEAGMTIRAFFDDVSWQTSDLVFTNKVESGILAPDAEVNGIPAFTLKSLDAEADKLYDVEFKSELDDVNVALSASSPMFNFLSVANNGYVYEATQDFTIEAPVYHVGSEYKTTDKPTKLKAFKTTGENWFDGTYSDPWDMVQVVVDGVTYDIRPASKATLDSLGITIKGDSYFILFNPSTFKWMEKVTVPAGTQVKFIGAQRLDGSLNLRVARMLMGESYDYRFKLFINEDEQAYGDVQVGQEFENTITLSGTYEDNTTFSYTIPVVED